DKIKHLLGQALQLDAGDPNHISIAMEMARTLNHVFDTYTMQATSVPPMVLSAAAEIHTNLDVFCCNVATMPVWTNIQPDDPHAKNSPLYPLSIRYGTPDPPTPAPPPAQPTPGPSKGKGKEKAIPEEDTTDDRGHQLECSKHPRHRTMTVPQLVPAHKPLKGVLKKRPEYVEIDELDEEPIVVGPAPKMGTPYVDVPHAPKVTGQTTSSSGLKEFKNTDTTSP
ncbi:hypothetical protein CY34DRAFT_111365, partial [Suillus luteus UH-Slu-Lm8-n1]